MKVSELSVKEFESIIKRVFEEKIEEGLKDIREGRTKTLDEIKARKGVKGG